MDKALFSFWFSNVLLKEIFDGHTDIMDNASIHKNEKNRVLQAVAVSLYS